MRLKERLNPTRAGQGGRPHLGEEEGKEILRIHNRETEIIAIVTYPQYII